MACSHTHWVLGCPGLMTRCPRDLGTNDKVPQRLGAPGRGAACPSQKKSSDPALGGKGEGQEHTVSRFLEAMLYSEDFQVAPRGTPKENCLRKHRLTWRISRSNWLRAEMAFLTLPTSGRLLSEGGARVCPSSASPPSLLWLSSQRSLFFFFKDFFICLTQKEHKKGKWQRER